MNGEVERVLAEHRLNWGTSSIGTYYAYCSCSQWSNTSRFGGEVQGGHDAHVAEALAPVLADAWDAGYEAFAVQFLQPMDEAGQRPRMPNPYRADALDQGAEAGS